MVGQRFIVEGHGFLNWPNELVLSYSSGILTTRDLPSYALLVEVERTESTIVFESQVQHVFDRAYTFSHFASPFVSPRVELDFEDL